MAGTTWARKRKRSALTAAPATRFIPEDVVHKILLRLPSRSVLRFRAVCKAWRDLFSDPKFVVEHHDLQPDLPLVSFLRDASKKMGAEDCCVEALDLRAGDFRSVLPFSDTNQQWFRIHGSCNGLLLLSFDNCLYVCNPATHQWTRLGRPSYSSQFVAFYRHDSTGEYRALLYRGNGPSRYYYTIVAGGMGRSLGPLPSVEDGYKFDSSPSGNAVLLRGNLHWPPEPWENHRILVFDTVTEVFSWMRPPPPPMIREHMPVLEMEGMLAVFSCDEDVRVVELWLLQDYENQMWVCKYHLELPALEISTLPDLDVGYDDEYWLRFFMSEGRLAVVIPQQRLLLYDMNGNLQKWFHRDGRLLKITPYTLKESLVRHAFFEIQNSGDNSEDESPTIF